MRSSESGEVEICKCGVGVSYSPMHPCSPSCSLILSVKNLESHPTLFHGSGHCRSDNPSLTQREFVLRIYHSTSFSLSKAIRLSACLLIAQLELNRALTPLQLQALEDNLGDLNSDGSLGDRILQLEKEQQAKIRSKDGVRATSWRRWLARTARAALSTKDVAMGLARLDKHGIAPIVLGGVFTVIRVIQEVTDEFHAAMAMTLEIGYIVSLWNTVEKRQILSNQDPMLADSYGKLSDAIVRMYENIVVLLGTMVAYFNKSKLRKCTRAASSSLALTETLQVGSLERLHQPI